MAKFPLYRQLDARDCGPACLRMVASWYGKEFPLAVLRDRAGVDREGVSMQGLSVAAESIRLEALSVQLSLDGSPGLREAPLPCILHWEQKHFVVLYKISGDTFHIADPAKGKLRLAKKSFLEKWKARAEQGIALLLQPNAFFEEQQADAQSFSWSLIWDYVKPFKALFRQLILGLVLISGIQLALPFLTKAVVDIGIGNRDLNIIWILLIGQLILILGQTSAVFFQNWIFLHLGTRFNLALLHDFLEKLIRLPVGFFDQKLMGDLLTRIQDHRRIELFVTQSSMSLLLSLFQLVIFGSVLLLFHPAIFGIFLLSTFLYVGWLYLFWNQRRLVDADRFEQYAENQHALIELIQGMPEIKLQGSSAQRRRAWARIQAQLYKVNMKGLRISQWQDGGTTLITQIKDIAILLVAASAVINGQLSLGSLLAIQFIVGQLNVPLQQISAFMRRAQDAKLSFERFQDIQQLPDENEGNTGAFWTDLNEGFEFRKVGFSYHPTKNLVLKDIDAEIPIGKITAIVGASGSGKTTMLKLMLGFYPTTNGQLLVNGTPLSNLDKKDWRNQCGAVLQEGFIFSDSIANNITEGAKVVDQDQLNRAVKMACLEEFVAQLPNGLNTLIGARGNGLSQGQKQRILLARAIYKNPAFLFLDEATNALDAYTEQQILQYLRQFYVGKTVVIVAHRLSTVKEADHILVLQNGQLVEQGVHDSLVDEKGYYWNLVKNQLDLNG